MRTEDHLVFSILTTHLNQGYFLGQALASALSQEGPFYIDYILVDAGSTDSTQEILASSAESVGIESA
jgi:glycosyltransferase involved in cell wall biosynthesis